MDEPDEGAQKAPVYYPDNAVLTIVQVAAGLQIGVRSAERLGGSGTTSAVATAHGRNAIYIDLNPSYADLARQRIGPMSCVTI